MGVSLLKTLWELQALTTSSQPSSDPLLCCVVYRRHWTLLFWRGWSHNFCKFQSILRHDGEFSAPENWRNNLEDFWFQQDGVMAHTEPHSREILQEMCLGRVIPRTIFFSVPLWNVGIISAAPCIIGEKTWMRCYKI